MKSLEARITALEQRKPAPNVCFVRRVRLDGSIAPLRPGTIYGKHVAEMPAPCKSADEWLKLYGPESQAAQKFMKTLERGRTSH